jgi:hypothetical protein
MAVTGESAARSLRAKSSGQSQSWESQARAPALGEALGAALRRSAGKARAIGQSWEHHREL